MFRATKVFAFLQTHSLPFLGFVFACVQVRCVFVKKVATFLDKFVNVFVSWFIYNLKELMVATFADATFQNRQINSRHIQN